MTFASFFHMTFVFWVVLDAPGSIPIYVSTLRHFEPKKQRRIIMREMLIALSVLLLFLFFGEGFFKLLKIDTPTLQVSGGIILFLIAIRLLFSIPSKKKETPPQEPFIVPLAVPSIAGPGILATITLYSGLETGDLYILLSIFIAWACSLPFLLLSSMLKKAVGDNGLVAIERLFGYLIALLAVQMGVSGLLAYFSS